MIPRLHVVTDDEVLARTDVVDVAAAILRAHPAEVAVHVRGPSTSGRRFWEIASGIRANAPQGALFVNDRVDVALALPGCGVHLRATSLPPGVVRKLVGHERLIGLSVRARPLRTSSHGTDPGQVDYLFAGSAFPTLSHPGVPAAGIDAIRALTVSAPVPVVAIGGISAARIGVLLGAGAHGVAVIRAVWEAPDPLGSVDDLLAAFGEKRSPGSNDES